MPTPASPSFGFVRPGATTASKSSTGPHGRKSGRQRVPSGAPFFRSTTPSASSNRRESSGPALEINSKPRQNGQSRAKDVTFISSNRWDVMGAVSFGFRALWVNRAKMPDEYAAHMPAQAIGDLSEFAELTA